jgi:hypothetical protein
VYAELQPWWPPTRTGDYGDGSRPG